jgi:hypothetical protein
MGPSMGREHVDETALELYIYTHTHTHTHTHIHIYRAKEWERLGY